MSNSIKLDPLPPLSRRNYMKFTIGKEEPEEFDIVHITLAQILVCNPNIISYKKEEHLRIFESDVNWIPVDVDMRRMLDGGLVPCVEFGVNSSRVETSYRYCYDTVLYGNRNKYYSYLSADETIIFDKIALKSDRYYLILGNFGKYHWD